MTINNVTLNQWQILQIAGLPLLFVAIGVLVKSLSKRSNDTSPHINDWAVGTSIVVMTFGKVAADLVEIQANSSQTGSQKAFDTLCWLFGLVFVLLFFAYHDRYNSHPLDPKTGQPDTRKRLVLGVLLPDIVSILIFALYQSGKVGII